MESGVLENSRAAIGAACDAGYGVEFDLQMSRDGEAVVFHDPVLDRLTGRTGRVGDLDAAELGQTILSGTSETIPTLVEILDIVAGRVPLLIELKDQDGELGANVGRLERRVAEILAGYSGPVVCMSFNPHSMAALREAAPELALGLCTGPLEKPWWAHVPDARLAELREIPDLERIGAAFVSHKHPDLGAPVIARIRQTGLAIVCWTIRSSEEEQVARGFADNITFEGYLPELQAT